jgi:hypothetical protein
LAAGLVAVAHSCDILKVMGQSLRAFLVPFVLLNVPVAQAVMFASTSDVTYNTTAPGGTLTNSGWQWQGTWGSYSGTPIAPTFFLAAKHISGEGVTTFKLNGFDYHLITIVSNPAADLVICQVAETFPGYAPLYPNTNETGKHCVVFGRGTQRGAAVIVDGQTNGWLWGTGDGVERWGENDVASIENDASVGELLRCTFDRAGGSNECHLSVGDSSGAMFIQDGDIWKVAGIHYAVDAYFSTNGSASTQFNAALLDMGGLYTGGGTNWSFITNQVADIPSAFYSTRIAVHTAWISSVINFTPGSDLQITGIGPVAGNIEIHFATGTNRVYYVDRRDGLPGGGWTTFTNNIVGTGGIMTAIDVGAASLTQRFYRVGLSP